MKRETLFVVVVLCVCVSLGSATPYINLHSGKILGLASGINDTDAINKGQLDSKIITGGGNVVGGDSSTNGNFVIMTSTDGKHIGNSNSSPTSFFTQTAGNVVNVSLAKLAGINDEQNTSISGKVTANLDITLAHPSSDSYVLSEKAANTAFSATVPCHAKIVTVGPYPNCTYQTDGVDDAVQVNEAWNSLGANGNGTVMGIGTLWISPTNPINLTSAHVFIPPKEKGSVPNSNMAKTFTGPGTGNNGLRICLSGPTTGTDGDLIKCDGSYVTICHMTLDGRRSDSDLGTVCHTANDYSSALGAANGIEIIDCVGVTLEDLRIWDCGDAAIKIPDYSGYQSPYTRSGSFGSTWSNIEINRCNYGLEFWAGGDLVIRGMTISDTRRSTVILRKLAGYYQFEGCHFWVGGNAGLNETKRVSYFLTYQNDNIDIGGVGHNIFNNCVIDNFRVVAIEIYKDAMFSWPTNGDGNGNIISNCRVYYGDTQYTSIAIDCWTSRNIITGNHLQTEYTGSLPLGTYQILFENGNPLGYTETANYNIAVGNCLDGYAIYNAGGTTGNEIAHNT